MPRKVVYQLPGFTSRPMDRLKRHIASAVIRVVVGSSPANMSGNPTIRDSVSKRYRYGERIADEKFRGGRLSEVSDSARRRSRTETTVVPTVVQLSIVGQFSECNPPGSFIRVENILM